MTHLLPELITDILCRLPVKSRVSKPWCSEIDSVDFIKLHLKTNTHMSLILTDLNCLFSVNFDSLDDVLLYSLGGCLCIVCHYDNTHVDVWVIKEYGVKESWINLFLLALRNGNEILSPVAYSKSGDRVLFYEEYDDEDYDDDNDDDGEFVWYNLRGKRSEEVRIQGVPKSKSFEVEMCVASLVPLNGGSGTNAMNQQAPVKKKNRKKR